ncbi:MAG: metallophosphoesterase [Thermoplasmatota archaeon]
MVKFSHIADCHLGAFGRNPVLREYNLKAFEKAVEISIEREVDFIIIAGDLFHNPHPDMDIVNRAVKSLMKARKNGISVYSVYGSHDFNISRASLIDVLESADVFKKVVHYLDDEGSLEHVKDPAGVSIAGLSGRKNRMDVSYYQNLNFKEPDDESIFVFHSPITEMKPADIHEEKTVPKSSLPEGYKYYAGGHIHRKLVDYKEGVPIVYPGPTFGSSYTDLEKDIHRGIFIVDDWEKKYVPIEVAEIKREIINADGWTIDELEDELLKLSEKDFVDDVVLLKVKGTLIEGYPEDIDFNRIRKRLEENGAETVYLNRRNLEGKETERIKVKQEKEEELEERVLNEYTSPDNVPVQFAEDLLTVLKEKQKEGETKSDYENRIWEESWHILQNIDDYRGEAEDKENEIESKGEKEEAEDRSEDEIKEKSSENKREETEDQENKKEALKEVKGQITLSDFGGDN